MLSKAVFNAMNEQITHEMASAYLYLSMSAYFESVNLPGFAHWMRVQFGEEQEHALKFFEYIHNRGNKVSLQPIPQVEVEFASPLEVYKKTLAHEQHVTSLINKIYKVAVAEDDVASQIFLQWFINEQVEEEKNASSILDLLEKMSGMEGLVYHIDHKVGKRGTD
jgi:ferritin